jgi:hypothetical protein
MNGLPVDEDKKAIEGDAKDTLAAFVGLEVPNFNRSLDKASLIDYDRVEALKNIFDSLKKKGELPDIIFFQEVVAKNFINQLIGIINGPEKIYKYASHFNRDGLSQGLSFISQYEIVEAQQIDIGAWLSAHGKRSNAASELESTSESLQSFVSVNDILKQTISGSEAWGYIVNNAQSKFPSLRPIHLVKIKVNEQFIWCINVHLKSNLPGYSILGLGEDGDHSDQIKNMAYTFNKIIREIYAYAITGFCQIMSKNGAFSYIVAGDFNTPENLNKSDPIVSGEITLKILKDFGFNKVSNSEATFPNLDNPEKAMDIDHIFWKADSGSYLEAKTSKPGSLINIKTPDNYTEYKKIDKDSTQEILEGRYYIIDKSFLSDKSASALFLAKHKSQNFYTEGIIKTGTVVKTGGFSYTVSDDNNEAVRKISINSTEGSVNLSLNSKLKLKQKDPKKGSDIVKTIKDFGLSSSQFIVDSVSDSFEKLVEKSKRFEFSKNEWQQIYYPWRLKSDKDNTLGATYWKGKKIVLDEKDDTILYECIQSHQTSEGDDILKDDYRKRYWKKVGPLKYDYVSDHNGLIGIIES